MPSVMDPEARVFEAGFRSDWFVVGVSGLQKDLAVGISSQRFDGEVAVADRDNDVTGAGRRVVFQSDEVAIQGSRIVHRVTTNTVQAGGLARQRGGGGRAVGALLRAAVVARAGAWAANRTMEAIRLLTLFAALEGAAGLLLPRVLPWSFT
jgi:hypothetical protein